MNSDFDIREYGAVPDGKTLNTAAIQQALDACYEAGGGRVLCSSGRYVTGSLELRSNVELHVTTGCVLTGSARLEDYEELVAPGLRGENAPEGSSMSLIRAIDAENIGVSGPGTIDASGLSFYDQRRTSGRFFAKPATSRPRILVLFRCRNVQLVDTSYVDSPCWTFWLMKCVDVGIHRISVRGDQRMINNDGIDLDSCRNVTVSDSTFKTGDDCIAIRAIQQMYDRPGPCENIVVNNCILDSWCQGIRIGCPGDGVIRNCTFTNLVINSENNGILFENPKRYLPAGSSGSADVHDVLFSNVVINCARAPIRVFVADGITLRRLSGLAFTDFRIRSGAPCQIEGCPETTIRDVTFTNMRIETFGEDSITIRNCQAIRLTNVELASRPTRRREDP